MSTISNIFLAVLISLTVPLAQASDPIQLSKVVESQREIGLIARELNNDFPDPNLIKIAQSMYHAQTLIEDFPACESKSCQQNILNAIQMTISFSEDLIAKTLINNQKSKPKLKMLEKSLIQLKMILAELF